MTLSDLYQHWRESGEPIVNTTTSHMNYDLYAKILEAKKEKGLPVGSFNPTLQPELFRRKEITLTK